MEVWKKRLVTLHHCPHINDSSLLHLVKQNPTLEMIYEDSPTRISQLLEMPIKKVSKILQYLEKVQIDNLFSIYEENNIQIITVFDDIYPNLLREIYDPPLVLYVKGNCSIFQSRKLGVVGSRSMTRYGQEAMEKIVPPLINEGFTIVSGLARGIDTLAHEMSIKHNGITIAVLGSGVLQVYPKENQTLANRISTNNLLISEYPPFSPPKKWNFPKRNRIISGLSEGVIIIEAKEKSGSLITADQAIEQGREVFAVPGSIVTETSSGTNILIQQGAKLVLGVKDILEELC